MLGLNCDHRMTRAVLHANPGAAARSPGSGAASSTTSPPASGPWRLSPVPGTSCATAADIGAAVPARAVPPTAPLPPTARAQKNFLAWRCVPAVAVRRWSARWESSRSSWPPASREGIGSPAPASAGADVESMVVRLCVGDALVATAGAAHPGRSGVSLLGGRSHAGLLGIERISEATRAGSERRMMVGSNTFRMKILQTARGGWGVRLSRENNRYQRPEHRRGPGRRRKVFP